MVVAQKHNTLQIPIYGAYVIGRLWFFVILYEKEYAVSLAYDATKNNDLDNIFSILTDVKVRIEPYL